MIHANIINKHGHQFNVQWPLTLEEAERLLQEPFIVIRSEGRRTAISTQSIDVFDLQEMPEAPPE